MRRTEESELQLKDSVSESLFEYLVLPVLLLVVAVRLLSIYWWTPFLWGFHHLHFFPTWLGWALIIATVSFFIPPVNGLLLKFFESICGVLKRNLAKINKHFLFATAGLLSLPLFWSLRTKFFLLGDGYFKLETLSGGGIHPTEPLDVVVHHLIYRLLTSVSAGIDPSLSYTIPSVVCGGVFIFLILILSDLLGKTAFGKALIFVSLVTLGSIELFFGYVESYTFLLVCLTLFILFSILYVKGRSGVIFSFLALSLGIGIHVSAIVLIPSLFYVILWKCRRGEGKLSDFFTLLAIAGCLGIIFLVIWKVFMLPGETNRFGQFLPLLPSARLGFSMFCGAHFGEFINQLFLVSPVGTILFLFFLLYTLKSKSFEDPVLNFLLVSSLSGVLLTFIYNSRWGSADWDLRSFPGIFFTLFGILLLLKWGSGWPRFKNYGLILMAVSFVHVLPWIVVNADEQMSVDRYVMITTNDKHILSARGGGVWTVGRVLEKAGFEERAEEIFREGIIANPKSIACYSSLGTNLYNQRRYDEAIFYLKKALELKPQSKEVRYSLGQNYMKKEETEKAIFHLEKIIGECQDDYDYVALLSTAYMRANRWKDAKSILEGYLAKNEESAIMRGSLGICFYMMREDSSAKREWERALELNPDEPSAKAGLERLKEIKEE
jgi:Tfp pilus assembly protein PilF